MSKPKKEKAPKEKKPKKEKAPKEKKPRKEKAPKEGKGGKKKKSPLLLILPLVVVAAVAAIVIFVVLPRLGGGEDPEVEASVEPQPPELPSEFKVGEETVAGMTLDADESEAKAELAKTVVYTYTDLADAGKAAETYTSQLASESPAFSVVDEEFVRTSKPDFTTREGMVLLARNIVPQEAEEEEAEDGEEPSAPPEPDKVITVRIEWSKGVCVVTADEAEGTVTSPPPPPAASSGGGGSMSISQAQSYLEGLDPAKLGLAGTTMDEYQVLPIDGVVMVNDTPCTMLNIYSSDAQHSNKFMGSYLMSLDGAHLYRLDPATNEIKTLE